MMYHGCANNGVTAGSGKNASNSLTENLTIEAVAFVHDFKPCNWFSCP